MQNIEKKQEMEKTTEKGRKKNKSLKFKILKMEKKN